MMSDILNGLCSRVVTMTLNVVHRFMSFAPWVGQFPFHCNSWSFGPSCLHLFFGVFINLCVTALIEFCIGFFDQTLIWISGVICCVRSLLCPRFEHCDDRRLRCSWMWHCFVVPVFWRWQCLCLQAVPLWEPVILQPDNVWWTVPIINLHILQFPVSCYCVTLRSEYFPLHPVLKHLDLWCSCAEVTEFHTHTQQQIKL